MFRRVWLEKGFLQTRDEEFKSLDLLKAFAAFEVSLNCTFVRSLMFSFDDDIQYRYLSHFRVAMPT